LNYRQKIDNYIQNECGSYVEKLENFPKYLSRQNTARYIALYEIFKKILPVHGSIIECGVNWGGGLMWFAQLSAALEPVNFQRKIHGFDSFEGFVAISNEDQNKLNAQLKVGGFAADSFEDLLEAISLYDQNRFIGHIPKVMLHKGDACKTMPEFVKKYPHTVVSLLHLDFDLYEPTKVAIECFYPRMPKGGIIIFDELNNETWPGETVAVIEKLGLNNLRIERFPFEPHVSYAVIE
jgi:hypothetical protein